MKNLSLFCAVTFVAASVCVWAADSPKDEVVNAAKKLGDEPNYSWKTTIVVPESAQFKPGPSEGKTEKDGAMHVKSSFGDRTSETVVKGSKIAMTNMEGDWQSISEVEQDQGFGQFRARMARNLKTPADQAAELAKNTKELKKDNDAYSGELTEEGAKIAFRGRGGGDGPSVSNAKGSVKFWVKDGELSKYEFKVSGSMNFNGNDMDIDRTTTIEIKDVGNTKVTIPDGAKKKLS